MSGTLVSCRHGVSYLEICIDCIRAKRSLSVPDQALPDPAMDRPAQPRRGMLKLPNVLFGTLRRMHSVQRYSSLPVVRQENVAEHSWQIAMITYFIMLDLIERGAADFKNMGDALSKALMHDVSESLSGDIIRSYKHSSPGMLAACEEADKVNMSQLKREIGGEAAERMMVHWTFAKSDNLQGEIVKLADLLCVVSYCTEEHMLGNRTIDHVLKSAYENVLMRYHTHTLLGQYVDDVFPTKQWDDPYKTAEEK